jgi:5-methylthioadenosine/S-adenosylhomocysteine deaminase
MSCRGAREIDCSGKAILPGLIDAHSHLFQGLTRSLGEGLPLHSLLREFIWPWAFAIRPEEARIGQSISSIEAVRSGTTTVLDNYYGPRDREATLAVAAAMEEVGLRGVVSRAITGEVTDVARKLGMYEAFFRYSAEQELEITGECIEARPPGSRVGIWPAPLNLLYVDHDLLARSVEMAREWGIRWHTHCSETRGDPLAFVDAFGIRPVEWLAKEGLLGEETTLAHGIWLDDREVELLGQFAVGLAYNPVSNQYLASGVMRLGDLRRAGAVVGLGTDGPCCGHRQDMFDCMKMGVLLQRVHALDATAAFAEELLEMATREGARYLGIEAGVLAPGKLADIIVVDLRSPHLVPHQRTVATLVYAARGSDVVMTIVGGRVVYEDGSCTLVDEASIMDEAQARADEICERAGLEKLRVPWRTHPPPDTITT